jgi:hypothetical protein
MGRILKYIAHWKNLALVTVWWDMDPPSLLKHDMPRVAMLCYTMLFSRLQNLENSISLTVWKKGKVFRVFSCGRGVKKDRVQMTQQQEAFQADSKTKAGAEAALDVFFHPPQRLLNDASLPKPHFHSIQEYRDLHRLSISDPREFWSKVALFSLFLSFLSLFSLSLFSLLSLPSSLLASLFASFFSFFLLSLFSLSDLFNRNIKLKCDNT